MRFLAAVAAAALSFGAATAANANVITIGGVATVTCTPSCKALVGGTITDNPGPGLTGTPGMLSMSVADRYEFKPASPEEEALALSFLAGTSFTTGIRTDTPGSPSPYSFTTKALWIALKLGNPTIFIYNDTGGPLTIEWKQNGLRAAGLSHTTEFGETEVIPVPGALWLMGAGLAGLGFARRRKAA